MNRKLEAYCGLDCAECPAHIVYLKDDPELRKKTAAKWTEAFHTTFDPETFFCAGCSVVEGPHTGYCSACPVQKCASAKKVANCGLCGEYGKCAIIGGFLEQAKDLKPVLDAIAAGRRP